MLWIVPGLCLALVTFVLTLNLFLHFLPASLSLLLMSAASAFVGSASAGLILELLKGRSRLVVYTMAATWVLGLLTHLLGYGFLERSLLNGGQTASIPLVGTILTGVGVTVIPGLLTGSIVGGMASLIPESVLQAEEGPRVDFQGFDPNSWPGYEKTCVKCGKVMPFDSIYCSHCGSTLKRRIASQVRYCRFCGSRLHFRGEFCPDCGREIVTLSKPKVYVSQ
jgi:hypothetical protein